MDQKVDQLREDVVLFNRRIRTQRSGHLLTPSQLQALAHLDREGPMSARALADLSRSRRSPSRGPSRSSRSPEWSPGPWTPTIAREHRRGHRAGIADARRRSVAA